MNMPKITIDLSIKQFSEHLTSFLEKELSNIFKKIDSKIEVKFQKSEKYWKIPEVTKCYFYVYSKKFITVKDVIQFFDLDWAYFSGTYRIGRNKIACICDEDEAVWDQRIDNKVFLHPNVTWVWLQSNSVDLDLEYGSDDDED